MARNSHRQKQTSPETAIVSLFLHGVLNGWPLKSLENQVGEELDRAIHLCHRWHPKSR